MPNIGVFPQWLNMLMVADDEHPGERLKGEWELTGKGLMGSTRMESAWDGHIVKSFADPDMVASSLVHVFTKPENLVFSSAILC